MFTIAHSSVESSAPAILRPRVLIIYLSFELELETDKNNQKEVTI